MSAGYKSRWLFRIIGFFTWPLGLHYVYAGLWKRFGRSMLAWVLIAIDAKLQIGLIVGTAIIGLLSLIDVFCESVDGHGHVMH